MNYKKALYLNQDAYESEDWLITKSIIGYRVFRFLIQHMDSNNTFICSQKTIQEQFDVSKATIIKAIKLLKDEKYIDISKLETSNIYTINKQIASN